jgi:hypothetical protein
LPTEAQRFAHPALADDGGFIVVVQHIALNVNTKLILE